MNCSDRREPIFQDDHDRKRFVVFEIPCSFFGGGEDVHTAQPEPKNYWAGHMHVRIKGEGHQRRVCSLSRARKAGVGWARLQSMCG